MTFFPIPLMEKLLFALTVLFFSSVWKELAGAFLLGDFPRLVLSALAMGLISGAVYLAVVQSDKGEL